LAIKDANNAVGVAPVDRVHESVHVEAAHLEADSPLRLANDANIVQWIGWRTDTALFSILPINGT
jgi:hypothetical protein